MFPIRDTSPPEVLKARGGVKKSGRTASQTTKTAAVSSGKHGSHTTSAKGKASKRQATKKVPVSKKETAKKMDEDSSGEQAKLEVHVQLVYS